MRRENSSAERHPIPQLKDGDFLHGTPPSLWGIVPSKTGVDEAREILRAREVLKACEEYHHPQTGATGIACWPHFNLNHERGVVRFVEFVPSIQIPIADAIAARGMPEGVLSAYTDFPDGKIYTVLLLYFDKIWTTLSLVEQVPRTYTVTPETRIARITYCQPYSRVTNSPHRVAWKGYGDYPATDATGG